MNGCPCAFCRSGRRVVEAVTSDTYLLIVASATLGLLVGVVTGLIR